MTDAQPDPVSAAFVHEHVGHEVIYVAAALIEFKRCEGRTCTHFQDSLLTRSRSLIEFMSKSRASHPGTVTVMDCAPTAETDPPNMVWGRWIGFINAQSSHIQRKRANPDPWPVDADDKAGVLTALATVVVEGLKEFGKWLDNDRGAVLIELARSHTRESRGRAFDRSLRSLSSTRLLTVPTLCWSAHPVPQGRRGRRAS